MYIYILKSKTPTLSKEKSIINTQQFRRREDAAEASVKPAYQQI